MKYTILRNGSILFHRKNNTPPNVELKNYHQDPNDPWLYHPNFPPCKYLEYKVKITKCKKRTALWMCNAKDCTTTPPECNACLIREV